MNEITNDTIDQYVFTGSCKIAASFKETGDMPEAMRKHITLNVRYDKAPLSKVIYSSTRDCRVPWQNGYARKHYHEIENKSVVNVDYVAPAAEALPTARVMIKRETVGMGKDELKAYFKKLEADMLAEVS